MIYLLYGQPASGKTVLGRMLAAHLLTTHHIDGDEFRKLFSNDSYNKDGREKNIKAANAVATYLNKTQEGDVVLSLVNPYEHLRQQLERDNSGQVLDILLTSKRALRKEYHAQDFELGNPKITINTDREAKYTWESLISCINKKDYY